MNNKIEFLADELNREITRSIIGGAEKATPAQKEDLRKSSREVSRCGGY